MRDEVSEIKDFIAKLKARKGVLTAELKAIDSGIAAMEVLAAATHTAPRATATMTVVNYAGMSTQDAVREFLKNNTPTRFAVKEIQKELEAGGLESSSDNLYSIVYTALARLKDKPGSNVYQEEGKWLYRV